MLVPLLCLFLSLDKASVWSALDQGDAKAALRATEGMSQADLASFLRAGRPYSPSEAGRQKVDLVDDGGAKSWGYIEAETAINPAKPVGAVLLLHGLGDVPESLMEMYKSFAKAQGLLLLAPRATALAKQDEDMDASPFTAVALPEWWSYRSQGYPMRLLAEAKRRFNIDEDRVILSGYSMGGFGAWNLGIRFPDRFAATVAYAGGISRKEWYVPEDKPMRQLLVNLLHEPVFFLHGDADTTVPIKGDRLTKKALDDLGYEYVYREVPKANHMLPVGDGTKLHREITEWAGAKRRDAAPAHVAHVAHSTDHGVAYWVRIDEMDGDTAIVDAQWKKGNALDVETKGVKKLTLFVPDGVADPAKPVKVTWNGASSDAKVERGNAVLIDSWLLHEDRRMVWSAKVTLQ